MNQGGIGMEQCLIRFAQGQFATLRERLLADTSTEAFALLLGQRHQIGDTTLIKVIDCHWPSAEDYVSRGQAHLRLKREYIYRCLVDMQCNSEANTLIDVHTHPFCHHRAAFSGVDDQDEQAFHSWLTETLEDVHYASIVLSQNDYAARLWERDGAHSKSRPAHIKTQTMQEHWPNAANPAVVHAAVDTATDPNHGFLARSVLALGMDTMRQIANGQSIAIIGVGGLGSAIAEHLIHSGFHQLQLIDPDQVETTNLNRIVGATWQDAADQRLKVEAVREHLLRINPQATIEAHPLSIDDERLLPALVNADWLLLATDNHASRYRTQNIALRFGIPVISAGVNISVDDGHISDMSGEVIIARFGDGLCLNCLGRVSPTQVAASEIPTLGAELAQRGYISGQEVKEPAVKTLNAMLATLAVESLINQYTERQAHTPILVYENNQQPCIYPDTESIVQRRKDCFYCASIAN